MRAALLEVDGADHGAFLAEVAAAPRWRPVGISRFVRTAPHVAELAVEVVDAWQGRGVGRRLLEEVRDRARELGYRELHAEVLLGNATVIRLLERTFPGARLRIADARTGTVICPLREDDSPFDLGFGAFPPFASGALR